MMSETVRDPLTLGKDAVGQEVDLYFQPAPSSSQSFAASWILLMGSRVDPPGKGGLTAILARLFSAGTERRSKRAFAQELDRLAAVWSSEVLWDSLTLTVAGPADAWREILSLLAEGLQQPRLEDREVERVRREHQEAILRHAAEPAERAEKEFLRTLFPIPHPFHADPVGSPESLSRIRASDVQAHYRRHITPRGSRLVVTSPENPATVLREIQEAWGAWTGPSPPPPLRGFPPPRRPRNGLEYHAITGTREVEIVIGGPSVPRSSPDYPALVLAHEVLGGRPLLSRLFQSVREREGLAYHAGSDLEARHFAGFWTAEAGTGLANLERVSDILVQEARRLAQSEIGDEELRRIRESLLSSLPLSLESTSSAHDLAREVAEFDLPPEHWRRWPQVLRAIRPRDIRRAVEREWFLLEDPLQVAAGPPRPKT